MPGYLKIKKPNQEDEENEDERGRGECQNDDLNFLLFFKQKKVGASSFDYSFSYFLPPMFSFVL